MGEQHECYFCGGPTEPWVSSITLCLVYRCIRAQCFEAVVHGMLAFMHREGWYETPEKQLAYLGDGLAPAMARLVERGMIEQADGRWRTTDREQERCPFYLIGVFTGSGAPCADHTCHCDRPIGHSGRHTSGAAWQIPTRFERVKPVPLRLARGADLVGRVG